MSTRMLLLFSSSLFMACSGLQLASSEVEQPIHVEAPVSDVGRVYPIDVEREEAASAQVEEGCPVEPPSPETRSEIMSDLDERTRFRQPEGTAARVAEGPPEGFERPPGSPSTYGHASIGGFERAPGTADDLSAQSP